MVDDDFILKGLITVKDIQKKVKSRSRQGAQGRLRVGAAIGATGDFLERAAGTGAPQGGRAGVDTAHGHTERVMEAVRR